MRPVYALSAPWAHYDRGSEVPGIGRRRLRTDERVRIPAGTPLLLTVPEGAEVRLTGYRMGAHRESIAYPLGTSLYQLFVGSVGTRPDDNQIDVQVDDSVIGSIEIDGYFPRPAWAAGRYGSAPAGLLEERLDQFLFRLVDLIRVVDDPALQLHQSGWDRLAAAWSGDELDLSEPPMALIVRHANELRHLLADLAAHTRRILRRTRALTQVDRVQQLDINCIHWLSRQPGGTVYERAGPRQRILSVQRKENLDTLENRVLLDFAHRSAGVARAYSRRYWSLKRSKRWRNVDQYGRECGNIARSLFEKGITRPQPPIVPNYVLLQDPRYRRLWVAYTELLRHLDEEDECWRWQHRLWTDFCRLALQVALRQGDRVEIIAESPLRLSSEQRRGRWSLVDVQSAVLLMRTPRCGEVAVSILWDTTVEHPKLAPWMAGLGAATVLHVQSLESKREAFILVWPIHHFSLVTPDLSDVVRSAQRALHQCIKTTWLEEDVDITAGGLVMMSYVGSEKGVLKETFGDYPVIGVRFGTSMRRLRRGLKHVTRLVQDLIDDLLSGAER